jgi:hypothetical protein
MSILRLLFHGLLGLVLLCAAEQARAEGLVFKGLNLDLNLPQGKTQTSFALNYRPASRQAVERIAAIPNPCLGGIETVKYTHAQHPEKPSRRYLNEDIDGLAQNCYPWNTDSPLKFFVTVGAMTNSQFGETFFFGPGLRFELPSIGNFTPYVVAKAPWVIYAMRSGQGAVQGLLPTASLGFSYAFTPSWRIEAFKEWLPKGGVQIYGMSSGIRPVSNPLDTNYPYQPPLFTGYPMESKPRPTLTLQLSFQFF